MPDPISENGTTPTNGAKPSQGDQGDQDDQDDEETPVTKDMDVSDIDPEDTAQLNVENLRALLSKVREEARENVKATRMTMNSAKVASETRQFKTGGFKKV